MSVGVSTLGTARGQTFSKWGAHKVAFLNPGIGTYISTWDAWHKQISNHGGALPWLCAETPNIWGSEAGEKETKARSEGRSHLKSPPLLSAPLLLHPPLPSPRENPCLVPGALKRSLPGYKYPAIN